MLGLVHELAEYERATRFELTSELLHEALFGPAPILSAHVAEADGELVGIALWYLTFPSYIGRPGIYLEDLYVRPTRRGSGLGKALLSALAAECVRQGYSRLQWSVLNWNTSAIDFYNSLGATPDDDQTHFGLAGDALTALAHGAPGGTGV
ncbi:MAG TPA: GNAT family N-acetyltransferase [Streptosporangiaceae bacterium]|jgi:GNAT superfamily N-acetyltransferase